MRKFGIYFLLLLFVSCNKKYEIINEDYFRTLSIQDTLLNNEKVIVMKVGNSISDANPYLLVKNNQSKRVTTYSNKTTVN